MAGDRLNVSRSGNTNDGASSQKMMSSLHVAGLQIYGSG
jgi:hypothetical protein